MEIMKLKAILLSTDGGTTWTLIHQYYWTDAQTREFKGDTLEGRQFVMAGKEESDGNKR